MRTCRSFRKHSSVIEVAALLVVLFLVIAIGSCDESESCQLCISSTSGGSVTIPGEGDFTYDVGTVVELVAVADDGYSFQAWTGDTDDIADPNCTSTNITINGDCSIAASFEEGSGPNPSEPYE